MPTFAYTARDDKGQQTIGKLSAATVADVSRQLRAEGKFPTRVELAAESSGPKVVKGDVKVPRKEIITFSSQLSTMLDAGVTLPEALDCIAEQADTPKLAALLKSVTERVQQGQDFSVSLEGHPRSFPKVYIALIRASEKTGQMGEMLRRANAYLKDEAEIIRKVRGALTYPGIMFGFAICTTVFLLAFVLPKFTTIYANKGAALPMPTQILMTISNLLVNQWMFIVPGTALIAFGMWAYLRTEGGRATLDVVSLRTPMIGPMLKQLHLARGMRMLGTLINAGVQLVDGVQIAADLTSSRRFARMWRAVLLQIQAGQQLTEPLGQSPLVPKPIVRMLHSGEKGGRLGQVMETVAGQAEEDLKEKIAELTRYIEPAMILGMGVLIGGVTLALLLPVFTISRVVAN